MASEAKRTLFVELFPIHPRAVPDLSAYRLEIGGGNLSTIGGKLSYRLRRTLGGHWVWSGFRLVTDSRETPEIMEIVRQLWQSDPAAFREIRRVEHDTRWQPSPQATADFVARGLVPTFHAELRDLLAGRSI